MFAAQGHRRSFTGGTGQEAPSGGTSSQHPEQLLRGGRGGEGKGGEGRGGPSHAPAPPWQRPPALPRVSCSGPPLWWSNLFRRHRGPCPGGNAGHNTDMICLADFCTKLNCRLLEVVHAIFFVFKPPLALKPSPTDRSQRAVIEAPSHALGKNYQRGSFAGRIALPAAKIPKLVSLFETVAQKKK